MANLELWLLGGADGFALFDQQLTDKVVMSSSSFPPSSHINHWTPRTLL